MSVPHILCSDLKVRINFQGLGHKAAFYHGSMDPGQRAFVQRQWSKDEINIICATVAFGMGNECSTVATLID